MDNYKLRGTMAVFFFISRLFGVAPLKFEYKNGECKAKVYHCVAVYGYVITFVSHTSMMLCMYWINQLDQTYNSNLTLFPLLNFAVTICTLLISGIASYGGIRRIRRTFNYFFILKKLTDDINVNDSNQTTFLVLVYLILFAVYITIVIAYFQTKGFMYFMGCAFFFELYKTLIIGVENACIQLEIYQGYKKIREELVQLHDGLNSDSVSATTINSKSERVRVLTKSYVTICELVSTVNENSSGTMLLLFSNNIMSIMMSFCGFIDTIVLGTNNQASDIFLYTLGIIVYTGKTLLFIEPCQWMTEEVVEIRSGLSRLIIAMTPVGRTIRLELDVLYKELLLLEPSISPFDIYTVQRSLLLKTITVLTTYLVIIIQYIQFNRWKN